MSVTPQIQKDNSVRLWMNPQVTTFDGVDTFDIDAVLTGSIDGEVGADNLQGDLIDDVVLTGSDADGFAGQDGGQDAAPFGWNAGDDQSPGKLHVRPPFGNARPDFRGIRRRTPGRGRPGRSD